MAINRINNEPFLVNTKGFSSELVLSFPSNKLHRAHIGLFILSDIPDLKFISFKILSTLAGIEPFSQDFL